MTWIDFRLAITTGGVCPVLHTATFKRATPPAPLQEDPQFLRTSPHAGRGRRRAVHWVRAGSSGWRWDDCVASPLCRCDRPGRLQFAARLPAPGTDYGVDRRTPSPDRMMPWAARIRHAPGQLESESTAGHVL